MAASILVSQPPEVEPVTLAMARLHLRVDQDGDDVLIGAFITAARTWAEQYLNRTLIAQQLKWVVWRDQLPAGYLSMPLSLLILPMWFQWPLAQPGKLELPTRPVISVDAVSYGQWGKPDTTLAVGKDYDVDAGSGRLMIHPRSQVLPNDHMTVLFTAGYGPDASTVPMPITVAILILTAFLYENRGDAGGEMPAAAEMLLTPYRIVGFG